MTIRRMIFAIGRSGSFAAPIIRRRLLSMVNTISILQMRFIEGQGEVYEYGRSTSVLAIGLFVILSLLIIVPLIILIWIYFLDAGQKEHSVLRNYPVLGNVRYFFENIGPELRQYLFANNREGKPFSRHQYQNVVKSGKYKDRVHAFGSERDFEEAGFYIRNAIFPRLRSELRIDQEPKIQTKIYKIDHEGLFNRKEHREDAIVEPHLLADKDAVVLGEHTCRQPFKTKGLIGQSAMSYGSLGKNAITTLSKGLGRAGGTWMNTGEGGLSPHHLVGDTDIIMQIGPAYFGVRRACLFWRSNSERGFFLGGI